ncbi:MAG: HPr family phosphocarrier protein [Planctomycetota bacterium]|jgi:phosphotransferase system HPr (HPr) family protein
MLAGEDTLEESYETDIEIKNSDGLHMRPAMQFVDLANQFDCDITVSNNQDTADAKSIMQMTILAATCGTKLKITAKGQDAQEAIKALKVLVEEKLFSKPAPEQENKD